MIVILIMLNLISMSAFSQNFIENTNCVLELEQISETPGDVHFIALRQHIEKKGYKVYENTRQQGSSFGLKTKVNQQETVMKHKTVYSSEIEFEFTQKDAAPMRLVTEREYFKSETEASQTAMNFILKNIPYCKVKELKSCTAVIDLSIEGSGYLTTNNNDFYRSPRDYFFQGKVNFHKEINIDSTLNNADSVGAQIKLIDLYGVEPTISIEKNGGKAAIDSLSHQIIKNFILSERTLLDFKILKKINPYGLFEAKSTLANTGFELQLESPRIVLAGNFGTFCYQMPGESGGCTGEWFTKVAATVVCN